MFIEFLSTWLNILGYLWEILLLLAGAGVVFFLSVVIGVAISHTFFNDNDLVTRVIFTLCVIFFTTIGIALIKTL